MTFESIAALVGVALLLLAGGGFFIAPLVTRVGAIDTRIEALTGGGKLLTDYKEKTIEQITRLEEQVRALTAELAATKTLRDSQFTEVNMKIDKEIHGQADTREKAYQALQLALDKLDVKFLALTDGANNAQAMIVAMQSKVDILMRERDAATALTDSSRRKEHART